MQATQEYEAESSTSRTRRTLAPRGAQACEACRVAKVRCHSSSITGSCSRCEAMDVNCYFPPSRRGRKYGSKNRRHADITTSVEARRKSRSGGPYQRQGGYTEHQDAWSDNLPEEIYVSPIDHDHTASPRSARRLDQSQPSIMDTPLNAFRESLPVDDRDRDPLPSATIRNNEINAKDFRGALQAIVEAASHMAKQDNPPYPILPNLDLPYTDDQRFRRWTSGKLQGIMEQQKRYYQFGIHGSKRDVARALDPVEHGLVTESRVRELFAAYWMYIHPYCSVLDPQLHTPSFVRSRSAFLFTVILAIGAMVLSTKEGFTGAQIEEAMALRAHAEKLNLVIYTAGAKSIDIIQATLIWTDNALARSKLVDDDRWIRLSAVQRMAAEIGLHLPHTHTSDTQGHLFRLNDLRTRAWLLILDTKYFVFHGGFMSSLNHFELSPQEISEIERFTRFDPDASLPAFYAIHMFQRRMQNRLAIAESSPDSDLALDAEHTFVDGYLDQWIAKWCPVDGDPLHNWLFRYEATGARLLLHLRILKHRSLGADLSPYQDKILRIAETIFEDALLQEQIPHFSFKSGYVLFATDIMLRMGSRRDLVMRMALRMAGDPDKPTINSATRHNGYQMLSMLAAMRDLPKKYPELANLSTEVMDLDAWLSTFDTDAGNGIGFQASNNTALGPAQAMNNMPIPTEGPFDWSQLITMPSEAFDYTLSGDAQQSAHMAQPGSTEYPIPADSIPTQQISQHQSTLFSSTASNPFDTPQPPLQPNLGESHLEPLAQVIAQHVIEPGVGDGDLQSRILGLLLQLAGGQ